MMYTVPISAFAAVALLLLPFLFFPPIARRVNVIYAGLALLAGAGFFPHAARLLIG